MELTMWARLHLDAEPTGHGYWQGPLTAGRTRYSLRVAR